MQVMSSPCVKCASLSDLLNSLVVQFCFISKLVDVKSYFAMKTLMEMIIRDGHSAEHFVPILITPDHSGLLLDLSASS